MSVLSRAFISSNLVAYIQKHLKKVLRNPRNLLVRKACKRKNTNLVELRVELTILAIAAK